MGHARASARLWAENIATLLLAAALGLARCPEGLGAALRVREGSLGGHLGSVAGSPCLPRGRARSSESLTPCAIDPPGPGYASSTGSLPVGLPPDLPPRERRPSGGGRWTGKANAAEDANERYSAQMQGGGGRGASAEDVYAKQRGELARLERCASTESPPFVNLASSSAASLAASASAAGAKVYAATNGPSPYYARPLQEKEGGPLREGYGKIMKTEEMAKGMQRKADLDAISGVPKAMHKSSFSKRGKSPSSGRSAV